MMMTDIGRSFFRPTVAEIDLDALKSNLNYFQSRLPATTEVMAVVKADAYGHGAVQVAQYLQKIGVKLFAVAFLDEAIQLRKAGITEEILVLGYTPAKGIELAIEYNIAVTVYALEMLRVIEHAGERAGKSVKIHLKVDTGMGRIGFSPTEIEQYIEAMKDKKRIELAGIYTHFATADASDHSFAERQQALFKKVVARLREEFTVPLVHLSNTAAALNFPEIEQNAARIGIGLYGLRPSTDMIIEEGALKPVMSVKTEVIYVKTIQPGESVSYGATYVAERETVVATLPVGYADGFPRNLSNRGYVLIHSRRAPIIGRVCMDQTMVDVTGIADVMRGDEVVIFGEQQGEKLTVDYYAELLNTINYELVTIIGKRIPRIYTENKKPIEVVNTLFDE
jgi:alanine racemase